MNFITINIITSALKEGNLTNRYNAGSESQLEAYQDGVSSLGMACYIEGALSSLLLLAYDFHDDFVNGTLTNANCGGKYSFFNCPVIIYW